MTELRGKGTRDANCCHRQVTGKIQVPNFGPRASRVSPARYTKFSFVVSCQCLSYGFEIGNVLRYLGRYFSNKLLDSGGFRGPIRKILILLIET